MILSPVQEELNKLSNSTNRLIEKVKKEIPKEIISEDSLLKIMKFYFKEDYQCWVVNVTNSTDNYFRKVEFWLLEDNKKLLNLT